MAVQTLAASNPYLRSAARKSGVARNVRSSSAMEGVSSKVFSSAASGQFVAVKVTATKARCPN